MLDEEEPCKCCVVVVEESWKGIGDGGTVENHLDHLRQICKSKIEKCDPIK